MSKVEEYYRGNYFTECCIFSVNICLTLIKRQNQVTGLELM